MMASNWRKGTLLGQGRGKLYEGYVETFMTNYEDAVEKGNSPLQDIYAVRRKRKTENYPPPQLFNYKFHFQPDVILRYNESVFDIDPYVMCLRDIMVWRFNSGKYLYMPITETEWTVSMFGNYNNVSLHNFTTRT